MSAACSTGGSSCQSLSPVPEQGPDVPVGVLLVPSVPSPGCPLPVGAWGWRAPFLPYFCFQCREVELPGRSNLSLSTFPMRF